MKSIVVFLLGVTSAWDREWTIKDLKIIDRKSIFQKWIAAFGRNYTSIEEEVSRFSIWLDNLHLIANTNSEDLPYKFRLNQFSDMTANEFRSSLHHGVNQPTPQSLGSTLNSNVTDDYLSNFAMDEQVSLQSTSATVDWYASEGILFTNYFLHRTFRWNLYNLHSITFRFSYSLYPITSYNVYRNTKGYVGPAINQGLFCGSCWAWYGVKK